MGPRGPVRGIRIFAIMLSHNAPIKSISANESGLFGEFLLDDGLGFDSVEQLGKGCLDMLADISRDDEEQEIVTRLQFALCRIDHDFENAGALFQFGADFFHASSVRGNPDPPDGSVIFAGPAPDNAVMYEHHSHVVREAGQLLEVFECFIDVHAIHSL